MSSPGSLASSSTRSSWIGDLRTVAVEELWPYRGLAWQLTLRDIRIRYKQAAMGFAWAILMPALVVLAGAVVRWAMSYVGGGTLTMADVAGIAVKALPWSFFVGAIGFATTSLTVNSALVTKIYFPREVLPLAATFAAAFDSTVGAVMVGLALPFVGVDYTPAVLWAPLVGGLLLAFTAGAALLLSCANLFFRDVKYLVQVFLSFGIFFTPVFFDVAMFGPDGARLMMLNPLAPLLEGLRLSVVEGHNLASALVVAPSGTPIVAWTPWDLGYSAIWAIVVLVGGVLTFHRSEFSFAEYA